MAASGRNGRLAVETAAQLLTRLRPGDRRHVTDRRDLVSDRGGHRLERIRIQTLKEELSASDRPTLLDYVDPHASGKAPENPTIDRLPCAKYSSEDWPCGKVRSPLNRRGNLGHPFSDCGISRQNKSRATLPIAFVATTSNVAPTTAPSRGMALPMFTTPFSPNFVTSLKPTA